MEPPSESALRDALHSVIDPEVGMNVVDLGLVYRIDILPGKISVDLTMTTPACPMGALIVDDARRALRRITPPHMEVDIRLVWDPPWTSAMMSDHARKHFGWS